jgi:F420-dependent oxidoreductase-like protein
MEIEGFALVSVPHIFALDAIGTLTVVGTRTERIELVTGVVPTPPRHPVALAQQALTAQVASNGRFTLGIGLSHRIVIESMLGLSYQRVADQMREYLEVLMPLVQGRPVAFRGEFYQAQIGLQVETPPIPVLVAALGPRMLRLTGERADGTITWMTGPKTLGAHVVPTLLEAAKDAGRPQPRVTASLPIALVSDPRAARETANRLYQIYGTLPSYRAMLDREGAAHPGDVAIVGDEAALRSGLRRCAEAGVSDFAASLFGAEDGCEARTREFLRSEIGRV